MGRIIPSTNVKAALAASRGLPQGFDQQDVEWRGSPYGEIYNLPVLPEAQVAADEGSLFTITNPTPGTGIATIAAPTTLADTSPFIMFKNNWAIDDAQRKRIIPKWLRLTVTAPGTAGTALRFAAKTDGIFTGRYTSGATVIAGNNTIGTPTNNPINTNAGSSVASSILFYAGPLVAAAAVSPRLVDHVLVRPVIPVVGDTYFFLFGGNEGNIGSLIPSGTAIADRVFCMAPMVVPPAHWGLFHIWLPSQSAASSYEFTFAYVER